MGRKASFNQKPKSAPAHKSLRLHAREAAEYLTGLPYLPKIDKSVPLRTPGRGASGESSN
jgi:hypothetical protein